MCIFNVSLNLGIYLVVGVADVTSLVLLVGASVDQALCIVDVAVASCTARRPRVGRVGHVEVDQATTAGEIASHSDGFVTTH